MTRPGGDSLPDARTGSELRISIVTPSFNQVQYLETTMTSVLAQHYDALEYVVVDGGSNDGSIDTIRRHADELTWWVSEPDDGHAEALNKGFAHTSGEIMGWINSSDFHLPWTLRVVAEVFASHPEVTWITGVPCIAGSDGLVRATQPDQFNRYDFLSGRYTYIQQESTFWRRDLWDAVGGLDSSYRYASDLDLWTRFFAKAELYSVSCALAAFRWHDERLGRSVPDDYDVEARVSYEKMTAAASPRDLRRARGVALARRAAGNLGCRLVEACPGCGWYRHPRLSYDFGVGRWKADPRK